MLIVSAPFLLCRRVDNRLVNSCLDMEDDMREDLWSLSVEPG